MQKEGKNSINREIGSRLKQWGKDHYGSIAALARALGMKNEQQLYDYFSGKSAPGNKLQNLLRELGCDLTWLMTGMTKEQINVKYKGHLADQIAGWDVTQFTPEQMEVLKYLSLMKVQSLAQLLSIIDQEKAQQHLLKQSNDEKEKGQ